MLSTYNTYATFSNFFIIEKPVGGIKKIIY